MHDEGSEANNLPGCCQGYADRPTLSTNHNDFITLSAEKLCEVPAILNAENTGCFPLAGLYEVTYLSPQATGIQSRDDM